MAAARCVVSLSHLPTAFEALRPYRQWSVWQLVPDPAGGKPSKKPVDHRSGRVPAKGHGGSKIWTDFDTAARAAQQFGATYGVAFNFTANDPFAFIDIDNALQSDRTWSPLALEIVEMFPNAAWEVSASGRGLHGFISYVGKPLPHGCKNVPLEIELYTEGRWAALTFTNVQGNAATDYTQQLSLLIGKYFPSNTTSGGAHGWTDSPLWHAPGSHDDDNLIARARRSKSVQAWFRGKASFDDLWTGNTDVLSREYPANGNGAYDASSADQALANHLVWWTRRKLRTNVFVDAAISPRSRQMGARRLSSPHHSCGSVSRGEESAN